MNTAEARDDAAIRQAGRALLIAIHGAQRALRLYPVENAAVQHAFDDLLESVTVLHGSDGAIDIRLAGDVVFVNQVRLRLGLDNFAAFSGFVTTLKSLGVGVLRIDEGATRREWQAYVAAVVAVPPNDDVEVRREQLLQRLQHGDVAHITIAPPGEGTTDSGSGGGGGAGTEGGLERAKRTYAQGVAVAREVVQGARLGRVPSARRIKRAIQVIVDQVMDNEMSITGLTTLRDYDEYTFTHSVNVCIFAVALGKRLGFDRIQLYDLGLAALLHDIGKARLDPALLNKDSDLDDSEWRTMQSHAWLGTLTLFKMREGEELPYRAILAAHEHHMKMDLTGYPRPIRPRKLGLFTRLVAVADGYDAATTRRVYQDVPWEADAVLREMWTNRHRGYDPTLVKALINLLGIYPVGTCVILDTFEVGVVAGRSRHGEDLHRPMVRLITDESGMPLRPPGTLVDLTTCNSDGSYPRSIIKVTSPERYGIVVGDYFL